MKDKVQLIKEEIKWLKRCSESALKEWLDKGYEENAFAENCRIKSFDEILFFIDSLSNESTPSVDEPIASCEDLEEAAEQYAIPFNDTTYGAEYSFKGFKAGAEWCADHFRDTTKMVSEGLEEAAMQYLDNHKPLTRYNWGDLMDAFKAGAEWGAEHVKR